MRIETDYALFAWILINVGRNWKAFADRPEVRAVLQDPAWRPDGKVMQLYEMAFDAPAAPELP